MFWKCHDCAFVNLCTERTVGIEYFYSLNVLDCFLWMFSHMKKKIIQMRVVVARSTLATHLSEGLPGSQSQWVCLLVIMVCFIGYRQSIY